MRILFFHRWVGVRKGGTETHIVELANRLHRLGHSVAVLTLDGEELSRFDDGITKIRVSKSMGENLFSYDPRDPRTIFYTLLFSLKALCSLAIIKLRGVHFDVVSVHFVTEVLTMKIGGLLFRWPVVFVFEGYTDLEALCAKMADRRIAITNELGDRCLKKHGYMPIIIPPGVDCSRFTHHVIVRDREPTEIRILSVGRLVPEKEYDILVGVAKLVCSEDSRFRFMVVGEGRERHSIETQIRAARLTDKVILTGRVDDEELRRIYAACDIFVTTQLAEDEFWISMLEAMSSGLPVIARSRTRSLELVDGSGLVVSLDPKELASIIISLGRNVEWQLELSTLSLMRARDFEWERLLKRYESAYQPLIRNAVTQR